jgi:hypothetical protein
MRKQPKEMKNMNVRRSYMAYFFLLLVMCLWITYLFGNKEVTVLLDKEKISGIIVVSIIAAMTAEGILSSAEADDLYHLSLKHLEAYILENKGLNFEEWATYCYKFTNTLEHDYMDGDVADFLT